MWEIKTNPQIERQLSKPSRERYLAHFKKCNERLIDFQEKMKQCELQFIKAIEENLELFATNEISNEKKLENEEIVGSPILISRKRKNGKKKAHKKLNHAELTPTVITSTTKVPVKKEYHPYVDNYNSEDIFEEPVHNWNIGALKIEDAHAFNVNQNAVKHDSDETYYSDAEK